MARICENCNKTKIKGKKVTDAWGVSYRSNRQFGVNLQKTTVIVDGIKRRVRVCTKCLKELKKSAIIS
ncbi:50S ribosomal protein L28 [Candidatus Parcubacteria bacterium]|nr:50S ribosomal protein L28 [Patescibacteria group bacterium]MBU4380922.1 50S ribosomal protein L28 [Patescibacteria group bacterium]MCG2689440.1 50S ribosomal protein L28 [Candidatus Parcubacteria bacterium]